MVQLIIFFSFAEHSVRLSEYVYRPVKKKTDLCDPDGFQWKRNVTVSMVITGEQHLMFLQHAIPVKNDVLFMYALSTNLLQQISDANVRI